MVWLNILDDRIWVSMDAPWIGWIFRIIPVDYVVIYAALLWLLIGVLGWKDLPVFQFGRVVR